MQSRQAWMYGPVAAAAAAAAISLPVRLSFKSFMTADAGASLAATILTRLGQRPNLDFGYPFGPLSLALQQWTLALIHNGPVAMTLLTLVASLGLGWGASWALRRLDLGAGAAALLTTAAAVAALTSFWPPVYTLEAAALLWAVVSLAAGERARGLFWCVIAALLKPSMGVVLGALFVAEAVVHARAQAPGARAAAARRALLPPALAGAALCVVLVADFGLTGFLRLALPLAGARNYRASHFSFFSRAGNPFLVPGARLGYYLGTPVTAWALACLVLLAAVIAGRKRWSRPRWIAAACCLLGTAAFLAAFYSWQISYCYYLTLPLLGLALLELPGRGWRNAQVVLALVMVLGLFTAVRDDLQLWKHAHPSAATAGLWATPIEAAEWSAFAAAHAPASHPVLLLGNGAPEAVFADYGPPWHGFLYAGEVRPRELEAMAARATSATCAALSGQTILPPLPAVIALDQLRPVNRGELFDTYGCETASSQ